MNEICLSCRKHTKCGRAEHETIGCGYYVPLTEQEYIQTCNTEQLAEWMALRLNPGILLALRMKYHCDNVDAVREWLKEKHD